MENYLEANLKRNHSDESQVKIEWETIQRLIEAPWFGENMGQYAVKVSDKVDHEFTIDLKREYVF